MLSKIVNRSKAFKIVGSFFSLFHTPNCTVDTSTPKARNTREFIAAPSFLEVTSAQRRSFLLEGTFLASLHPGQSEAMGEGLASTFLDMC